MKPNSPLTPLLIFACLVLELFVNQYRTMAEELSDPPSLHLLSAFLAMEPVDSLLSMARELGGGLVTETVQSFIWDYCIRKAEMNHFYVPYVKKFLKKLISEVESSQGEVLDGLYELYAHYMVSWKDENQGKEIARVSKIISFLFPDGSSSFQKSRKFMVPLQCSLNMLEGDTGCSIWPSSLYLSELILSFPDIFSARKCFEVGSGVGLVGICLAHVKTSKVVLSDGDLSTLTNMKVNLELNGLCCLGSGTAPPERSEDLKIVECIHLPWESASESELQDFSPDIVVGADVIYDPICLPHLVHVLSILLRRKPCCPKKIDSSSLPILGIQHVDDANHEKHTNDRRSQGFNVCDSKICYNGFVSCGSRDQPLALIASVIRNIDTFNRFRCLAEEANLIISDVTDEFKPLNLLSYMYSYNRSSIRLFTLISK